MLRILLLFALATVSASAQSHKTEFDFTFITSADCPDPSVFCGKASGQAVMGGFGTAAVEIFSDQPFAPVHLTFHFAFNLFGEPGDLLVAVADVPAPPDGATQANGNALVTNTSSGRFLAATGNLTFTISSKDQSSAAIYTGHAVIFTYNVAQICAGGGATLSSGGCVIWICQFVSHHLTADCNQVRVDANGAVWLAEIYVPASTSSLPIQLLSSESFAGGQKIAVFDGPGRPYYLQTRSGGSHGLLEDCQGCHAVEATTTAGVSLQIVTPVETAATTYTATVRCFDQTIACWLTVPNPTGPIPASSAAGITAQLNTDTLNPGAYFGNVGVGIPDGTVLNTPVTVVVAPPGPLMALSQPGLGFQAVAGGAAPAAQSIAVSNAGTGALTFSAAASGGSWLSVSSPSGSAPAQVSIRANPAGLAPGVYSGRVDFSAAGASNAPQSVKVTLTVLPSATRTGPVISPAALVFVAAGNSPAPQAVQLSNPSNQTLTVTTTQLYAQGNGWFSVSGSGSALTPAQPITETVTVNTAGLTPGMYAGELDLHVAETGTDYGVTVLLVVKSGACTPTQLLSVFTNLEGGFQRTAGQPIAVQAMVVDDCGSPLTSGTAAAYFGGSDTEVSLTPLGQGLWTGAWLPRDAAGGASAVGILAANSTLALYGSGGVTGTLTASSQAAAAPVGVAPGAGSASSQTFSFTFSDPRGYTDLGILNVLVNNFLDGRRACYLAYSQTANLLYLVGDDGGALLGGLSMASAGSITNSQCTVSWQSTAVTASGNDVTLAMTVSFTGSFAGRKVIYMAARDAAGNSSGWQADGVWEAPGAGQTTTASVMGMASGGMYTFAFADTQGASDLGVENILVNGSLDGRRACYLAYDRRSNVLYLVNDNGDGLLPGQVLSAPGSVNNSQCTVSWGSSPVTGSGNNLALSLNLAFSPSFGNLVFYLAARDARDQNNTGWQPMGTSAK